jgi:hypothetical protein
MNVHYQSGLARLILPRRFVAITLGSHVYTRLTSLSASTLRHEGAHIEQWKRHGVVRFAFLYLWYHFRYGYDQNPFEVEARNVE